MLIFGWKTSLCPIVMLSACDLVVVYVVDVAVAVAQPAHLVCGRGVPFRYLARDDRAPHGARAVDYFGSTVTSTRALAAFVSEATRRTVAG